MNQPPNGLCGSCGAQLPPGGTFCPRCGAGAPPAGHPGHQGPPPGYPGAPQQGWQGPPQGWQGQPPQQGWQGPPQGQGWQGQQQGWQGQPPQQGWQGQPEPPRRRRRTGLLVGVAALVLLLVAGGAFLATRLIGGSGGGDGRLVGMYEGVELAEPVTSEPEETWSWTAPDSAAGGVDVGDSLVVTVGDSEVVSLDASGKEEWKTTIDPDTSVSNAVPGQDVLIASAYDVRSLTALSAKDGEELWAYDDRTLVAAVEEGVVFETLDELGLLDAESGDERWAVETPDAHTIAGDAAYLLSGKELTKVSLEDGEEQWTVSVDRDEDAATGNLAANEELVTLDGDEVVAFDAESGDELWTEAGGESGSRVGVFSTTEVYLTPNDLEGESEPSAIVFDRDGEVGELDVEKDEDDEYFYFYLVPFESGGSSYAFDYSSGRLYGDDREVLATYEGSFSLAAGGIYALDDGKLSYYELGSDSAEWTIDVDGDSETAIGSIDGRVLVYAEDTVTNYE